MKAKEVMKLLNICRTTLYNYTKDNVIKTTKLSNGYYDYDEQSVLKFIKKDNRINVLYARVSTSPFQGFQSKIGSCFLQNNNIIILYFIIFLSIFTFPH